jgi:ribosomal protein L11 methyltransferase
MAKLVRVRVRADHAERAAALLFELGFDSLVEESRRDGVVLSASADAGLDERLEQLRSASAEQHLATDVWVEELNDDWQTAWIAALEPVQLTPGVKLVPREPEADTIEQGAIYLKPALAFGYGDHATTRMAAAWLAEHCAAKTLLDVGTGTGVLCLVAARLGAAQAHGIDIDAASVDAAQANALLNDVSQICSFATTPLGDVRSTFDVVVANIDAVTLAQLARDICRVSTGRIALTGILEEQRESVCVAFREAGRELSHSATEGDWVLLSG